MHVEVSKPVRSTKHDLKQIALLNTYSIKPVPTLHWISMDHVHLAKIQNAHYKGFMIAERGAETETRDTAQRLLK